MNLWDQVLARIETKVNRHSFYTWFKPTSFVDERDGRVRVRVPNALFRDWLTKHYTAVIDEALTEVDRAGAAIAFVTEDVVTPSVPAEPPPEIEAEEAREGGVPGSLSPRSTPSSWARRISLRTRPAEPSRRLPGVRTTRCSSTAELGSAKRT